MIDLLVILIFNSLYCFGFWNACLYSYSNDTYSNQLSSFTKHYEKGVLWFVEKWAKDKWFYKPLCGCLPCMASVHSIIPYWSFMYVGDAVNWNALILYPIYIVALSGLNYLIERS